MTRNRSAEGGTAPPETYTTRTERETAGLGGDLGRRLRPGDTVALYGELGTGKTRFIQGICKALGVNEHVASPTFTIVNEYHTPECDIYHFDLYRVNSIAELRDLGFEEYVSGDGVCLIEWAEKAAAVLPARRYDVVLKFGTGPISGTRTGPGPACRGSRDLREITITQILGVAA